MSSCTTLVWPIIEEIICIYIIRDVGAIYIYVYIGKTNRVEFIFPAQRFSSTYRIIIMYTISHITTSCARSVPKRSACSVCVCVCIYIVTARAGTASRRRAGRARRQGQCPSRAFQGYRHHRSEGSVETVVSQRGFFAKRLATVDVITGVHTPAHPTCRVDISVARAPDWRWRFLSRVYCIGTIPHLYSPTNSSEY